MERSEGNPCVDISNTERSEGKPCVIPNMERSEGKSCVIPNLEGCEGKSCKTCVINRSFLPIKATYFFLLGGIALLLPYLPVFMRQLNLTPIEIAIIFSVVTAFTAPARPIVGIIADKLSRHNMIIIVCCVATSIFHLSLYFIPPEAVQTLDISSALEHYNQNGTCNESLSVLDFCGSENLLQVNSSHPLNNTSIQIFVNDSVDTEEGFAASGVCVVSFCKLSRRSKAADKCGIQILPSECKSFIHNGSALSALDSRASSCLLIRRHDCHQICHDLSVTDGRYQNTFITFFVIFFFAQFTLHPIFSILDSVIFTNLGDCQKDFGKQRLWGTISLGIFALVSGFIVDVLVKNEIKESFLFPFIGFTVFFIISASTVLFYKKVPEPADGISKQNVCILLKNFYFMICLVTVLVAGFLAGAQESFFFYFLSEIGSLKLVMGISLLVACICEIVVLYFSGKFITIFGNSRCLYFIFFMFFVRFLAESFICVPWWAIATEATQCICYGLLYPVVSAWVSEIAPSDMQGTAQGLMGAVYFSMGRAAGTAVGGVLYEDFSPRTMFQVYAVIALIYMLILIFLFEVIDKKRKKPSKEEKSEEAERLKETELNVLKGTTKSLDTREEFISENNNTI